MRNLPLPLQTLPGRKGGGHLGGSRPPDPGEGGREGCGERGGWGVLGFSPIRLVFAALFACPRGRLESLLPVQAPAPMCVSAAVADNRLLVALAQQARLQDIVSRRSGTPSRTTWHSSLLQCVWVPLARPLTHMHHTSRPTIRSQTCFPPLEMHAGSHSAILARYPCSRPRGYTVGF